MGQRFERVAGVSYLRRSRAHAEWTSSQLGVD